MSGDSSTSRSERKQRAGKRAGISTATPISPRISRFTENSKRFVSLSYPKISRSLPFVGCGVRVELSTWQILAESTSRANAEPFTDRRLFAWLLRQHRPRPAAKTATVLPLESRQRDVSSAAGSFLDGARRIDPKAADRPR